MKTRRHRAIMKAEYKYYKHLHKKMKSIGFIESINELYSKLFK